jgi:hypothetical protein
MPKEERDVEKCNAQHVLPPSPAEAFQVVIGGVDSFFACYLFE